MEGMLKMKNMKCCLCLAIVLAAMMSACCTIPKDQISYETLNSVLWMQTSAEYTMMTTQAYQRARMSVEKALADPAWTAAIEQIDMNYRGMQPAIIVDIDETVLDTTAFQAELTRYGRRFTPALWDEWTRTASAGRVPGALAFLKWAAEEKGITIFYITNRDVSVEPWTMKNLEEQGFPVAKGMESIFSKGECGDISSDKSGRRRHVCLGYRILVLAGDNLGDFISSAKDTPENRIKAAETYASYWAEKWILLPNPAYGSWEGALFDYDTALTGPQILKRKIDGLRY